MRALSWLSRLLSNQHPSSAIEVSPGSIPSDHDHSPVIEILEPRLLLSATYFVSMDGADSNPGTLQAPFRTIQHAANVMDPGDTAYIRGGTYRETVQITDNNLTFEAYNDEYVVVTGADLVTGWTHYGGEIYAADFGPIETQFPQVFYNGVRQQIARYPDNMTGEILSINDEDGYADLTVLADGQVTFDTAPPGGVDHWVGGYVRAISGLAWANPTGLITASNGASITADPITTAWQDNMDATLGDGKGYILHLNALSVPGEWYYLNNTLYFWRPGGGMPTDTEVEAQRRKSAFVIDGYNGLTLRSLHIRSADIRINNSNYNLIQDTTFQHLMGWFTRSSYAFSKLQLGGVYVNGDNNIFDGCVFGSTWGSLLVFAGGNNNLVTDCWFGDNGWMSMYTAAIQNYAYNTTITHSTFGPTGRFHIEMREKANILHNDFYDAMKLGQDAGPIHAVEIDLQGAEIAYNTVHDMSALAAFKGTKQFVVAFYLEGSSNYTVHHNLVYNVKTTPRNDGAFVYLGPRRVQVANALYYNNTVWDVDWRIRVWNRDSLGTVNNVQFKNNVFDSRMTDRQLGTPDLLSQLIMENNVESSDAASLFVDQPNHDYRPAGGSPAIDAGQIIPGITDGYTGAAPDAGAFEQGVAPWEFGVNRLMPFYYEVGDEDYQSWLAGQLTPAQRDDPDYGGYLVDPGGNGLFNIADYALGIGVLSPNLPVPIQTIFDPTITHLQYERRSGYRMGVETTVEYADTGSAEWMPLTGIDPFVIPDGQGMETVHYFFDRVPNRQYRLTVSHLNGPGTTMIRTSIPFTDLTGDLDGDGFVGISDLNLVLANWNQSIPPGDPSADTSGDGYVGIEDLNQVLANWNNGTPPSVASVSSIWSETIADSHDTSPAADSNPPRKAVRVNSSDRQMPQYFHPIHNTLAIASWFEREPRHAWNHTHSGGLWRTGSTGPALEQASHAGSVHLREILGMNLDDSGRTDDNIFFLTMEPV